MKKIVNVLLGSVVFGFVGCGTGGTDQQGAMGGYDTFGSQNVTGIWNVYNANSSYIDRNSPNLRFELDDNGKLYNVPINNEQKQQVASYELVSNQELKITSRGGTSISQYTGAYQEDNNCFYANSNFNNQVAKELWCKQTANSAYIPNIVQGGNEPDAQGMDFVFKDFLYPYDTITTGIKVTEEVFAYNQNSDGTIASDDTFIKEFRNTLANNVTEITEKHNNQLYSTDQVYSGQIFSIDADTPLVFESYPAKVNANIDFEPATYNGVTINCGIKRITKGKDLKPLLPREIYEDMESKIQSYYSQPNLFNYTNNTIHVHCDASNGTILDEYYVDAYGSVLTISKFSDNTARYEVLNKLSIGN